MFRSNDSKKMNINYTWKTPFNNKLSNVLNKNKKNIISNNTNDVENDNEIIQESTNVIDKNNESNSITKEQEFLLLNNQNKKLQIKNITLIQETTHLYNEIKKLKEDNIQLHNNNKQLHDDNKKLIDDNKQLSHASNQLSNESKQLTDTSKQLYNESNQLQNEIKQLYNESKQLQNEIKQLKNEIKQQQYDNKQLTNENNELTNTKTLLTNENNKLTNEISLLKNEKTQLTKDNVQLKTKQNQLITEKDLFEHKMKQITNENDFLEIRIKQLTSENEELDFKFKQLTNEKYDSDIKHNNLIDETIQLKLEKDKLSNDKKELINENKLLTEYFNKSNNANNDLTLEINNLKEKNNKLQCDYNSLNEENIQIKELIMKKRYEFFLLKQSQLTTNYVSKSKIFMIYQYKYANNIDVTGLGDFMRGCFYVLQLVDKYKINFEFLINNHPLKKYLTYFENNENIIESISSNVHFYKEINHSYYVDSNNEIHYKYKNIDEKIIKYIKSLSMYGYNKYIYLINHPNEQFIFKCHKEKIREILNPTNYILEKVDKQMETLGLVNKKFKVYHVRLGDDAFNEQNNASESNVNYIINKINIDPEEEIYLISNNNNIKNMILSKINLKTINHQMGHIAANSSDDEIINTLIDFYIMSHSTQIVSFSVYDHGSGFSKWCAVAYDIPYVCYKLQ